VAAGPPQTRQAFFDAEMGISGANFIVADSGVVAISTNEGNGRLTTSVPRIHVAVTGIEKVIPRLEDLATLWPVLATSGTGQPITTYSTMIGGPRRPGEADVRRNFTLSCWITDAATCWATPKSVRSCTAYAVARV